MKMKYELHNILTNLSFMPAMLHIRLMELRFYRNLKPLSKWKHRQDATQHDTIGGVYASRKHDNESK